MTNDDKKDDKLEEAEGDWENLSIPGSKPIEKPAWPEKYAFYEKIKSGELTPTGRKRSPPEMQYLGGTVSGRFSSSKPNFKEVEPNTAAATTASALSGKGASILIVDDIGEGVGASKLALALANMDLSDVELRVMNSHFGHVDHESAGKSLGDAFERLGKSFAGLTYQLNYLPLTGDDLRSVMALYPTLFMDKHEAQHSDHPTEKNPNHPRFQRQPGRPRRNRQRKQK